MLKDSDIKIGTTYAYGEDPPRLDPARLFVLKKLAGTTASGVLVGIFDEINKEGILISSPNIHKLMFDDWFKNNFKIYKEKKNYFKLRKLP